MHSPFPLIAVDCRFAATSSGLGRYSRELMTHLLRRNDKLRYVLLVRPEGKVWAYSVLRAGRDEVRILDVSHYSLAEQMQLPRIVKEVGADLLFGLHFNVPYFCSTPTVVTIHDLILHRFPNQASVLKQAAYRILMRRAVQRARRVIAVSHFVQEEISTVYGSSVASRTTVVHEGVSEVFSPRSPDEQKAVREHYQLPEKFFLYVGNAKEHKNVPLLLKAHETLGSSAPLLVLVCAGQEADRLTLHERVVRIKHVSDEDLPALYSAALAFVTPSLYEGFGLPVVEAIACGCPVIAADRGPVREVTGGLAFCIEPTMESFAQALRNPPGRTGGGKRLWDWNDAAEQTAGILFEALSR